MNGKKSAAKTRIAPLKMRITNYELRITNTKSPLRFFVILFVFYSAFAGNLFAQNAAVSPRVDWSETADYLSSLITGGTNEQKRDALSQIRNLEFAEASRIAVPALRDKSESVRATATASIVFLPKDEAAQTLLPLLADKKPLVRREAAYALGKVRSSTAINSLLGILQKDKVLEVRSAAIVALGEIGDESAVSELLKILQRKPQAKEEFLRRSAARSIGQIAQIIQTGRVEVLTPENFLPEKYKEIEKPAYPKLAETFTAFRPTIAMLIQTLRNPQEFQDVKREAAFALGEIGDELAIPVLQSKLGDADYYLTEICRESLEKISLSND